MGMQVSPQLHMYFREHQCLGELLINLPFTVSSSRKPTAVQAHSSHWITKLCIAVTWARTAVGKSKIPSQTPAAALTIHLSAAGTLPCHLVAQRAQRALWVAFACWKTPKAKLCPEWIPTNPAHLWHCLKAVRAAGMENLLFVEIFFLYYITHNRGFKALKS